MKLNLTVLGKRGKQDFSFLSDVIIEVLDLDGSVIGKGITIPESGKCSIDLLTSNNEFWIYIQKDGYDAQKRYFNVYSSPLDQLIILLSPLDTCYYQQYSIYPCECLNKEIGIIVQSANKEELYQVESFILSLGLNGSFNESFSIYSWKEDAPFSLEETISLLRNHKLIQHTGPVIRTGKSKQFFSGLIFLRPLDFLSYDEVESAVSEILAQHQTLNRIDSLLNGFVCFETSLIGAQAIHNLVKQLNILNGVAYCYPETIGIIRPNAINPTDYMFKDDFAMIATKLPDAYQRLHNEVLSEPSLGSNYKFGNRSIITAIMDAGIQSVNGQVINPELNTGVAKSTSFLQSAIIGGTQSTIDIISVDAGTITKGDIAYVGELSGTNESHEIINITSPATGIIRLHFNSNVVNSYNENTVVDINRLSKIYKLYNFNYSAYLNNGNSYPPNNDVLNSDTKPGPSYGLPSDHGTAVAGIVAATTGNKAPLGSADYGMSGVAPNTQLIGIINHPTGNIFQARTIEWLCGLDANADPVEASFTVFPDSISPSSDIYNASLGLGENDSAIDPRARLAIDRATSRGRNGRGMPLFLSSGNDDTEFGTPNAILNSLYYSYANYERTFMIGSSNRSNQRTSDGSGNGSNYGTNLEFCAPGSIVPSTTINGKGGTASFPLMTKTVIGPAVPLEPGDAQNVIFDGTTNIYLSDIDGLAQDMWVTIYDHNNERKEDLYIREVIGGVNNEIVVTSDDPGFVSPLAAGTIQTHIVSNSVDPSVNCKLVVDAKLLGETTTVVNNSDIIITITSAGSPNVKTGDQLFIGQPIPGNPATSWIWRRERLVVTGNVIPNGINWDIPVTTVQNAPSGGYPNGTQVILSYSNLRGNFGGTSAASPFAAGIAALTLGVKPTLTWVELREILRNTAQKTGGYNYSYDPNKPDHSKELGYGLLNADAAVAAAINYKHEERDLILRNNLNDNGSGIQEEVISPDIWVRNLPSASDQIMLDAINGVIPIPYTKAGPHQEPYYNHSRVIYTRIHNSGTTLSNLDCWVRFYIAESDGIPPAGHSTLFPWPDAWPFPPNPSSTYDDMGTNFLGEVKIPAGQIAPGQETIVSMPWSEALTPILEEDFSLNSGKKMYIMVEITPHDGLNVGPGVESNNNISYRIVEFAENTPPKIEFLDTTGENSLPRINLVSDSGTPITTDFRFKVQDEEPFIYQSVELKAVRTLEDGATEEILWTYNGTSWSSIPSSPTWMTMNNTVISIAGNPSGDPSIMEFKGSFDLSNAYEQLSLKVTFTYDQINDANILEAGLTIDETYVIDILKGVAPTGVGVQEFAKPTLHIFADIDNVSPSPIQTNAMAFGPVPGNESEKFRVTSSFTSTVPVKAFAAVTGTVAIQKENSDRINLIIRPLVQTNIDLTPVKYFIYRGLRRDNFIEASGNNMIPENTPGLSPFMQELYDQHNDRYTSNPPAPLLKSQALGWFPLQNGNLTLDSLFFNTNPDFGLPVVQKGTELGYFFTDSEHEFGFEIILEEGEIQIDLNNAREPFYEINVSSISDPLLKKAAREELRYYVDPVGYYGLHFNSGVNIPGTNAPLKLAALYTDFISYFATKNTIYLDVRNENGYSMNYYENYSGEASSEDEGSQLKLNFYETKETVSYSTNNWPIIIRNYSSIATNEERNNLNLNFKSLDNQKPILFVERGELKPSDINDNKNWVNNFFNLTDTPPNTWTSKSIQLNLPNIVDPSDSNKRFNVASSLKLHWLRSESPETWPAKVVREEYYTDNLFGPVDIDKLITKKFIIPLKKVQWFELQGLKHVNIPTLVAKQNMYHHGFAFDEVAGNDRTIFFATFSNSSTNVGFTPPQFADGANNEESFFHSNYVFRGKHLLVDVIQEDLGGSSQEVKLLSFEKFGFSDGFQGDVIILGLTKNEVSNLKALSGLDSSIHDRYIKLQEIPSPGGAGIPYDDLTVGNPKKYFKYKLGIQGQDSSGIYATTFPTNPNDNIYVYSTFNRYFFTSKDFAQNQSEVADTEISYEEAFIIGRSEPNLIISKDATMLGIVTSFETNIAAIPDDKNALQNLKALVETTGIEMWNQAIASVKHSNYAAPDSRPLYWARLRVRIAIKEHPSVIKSQVIKKELLQVFESKSRGYEAVNFTNSNPSFSGQGINFSTIKKVLVSGFDPFELNPELLENIYGDNLSGATALGLHDTIIRDNLNQPVAIVQAAIFPVRYEDFDQDGGLGVIEAYYKNYITPGGNEINYAITMSRDYNPVLFMDRFAVRKRGENGKDNDNQSGSSFSQEMPSAIDGAKFIESTLDVTKIVPIDEASNNGLYPIHYNQDFEFISPNGTVNRYKASQYYGQEKIENVSGSSLEGQVPTALTSEDLSKVTPIMGSGGNFLSNECFYRVSALRSVLNPLLPTGHLHVPHYQSTDKELSDDYDALKASASVSFIMNIIKNAIQ